MSIKKIIKQWLTQQTTITNISYGSYVCYGSLLSMDIKKNKQAFENIEP